MKCTRDMTQQELRTRLDALGCEVCLGSGVVDAACPGDISYNEYMCVECAGTGYADSKRRVLRVVKGKELASNE